MAFWSNLARIGLMAAPYVAAPFTGGTSLALIGAGAGAGNALLAGGDAKDALIAGGMGALPGVTEGLNKGAQVALQAGASGGMSTLQPGGVSTMPNSSTPTPPTVTAAPASLPATATTSGMYATPNTSAMPNSNIPAPSATPRQPSIWSRLARNPETWQAASQMIAAATESASRNRSSLGDVQRAEYLASGGSNYQAPAGSPTYGFGPRAPSGRLQQRASELEEHLMDRLTPSIWERIGTYAAPAAAIYGSVGQRR